MTEQNAMGPVKRVQIEATVIRANGTVEHLGVVADSKWRWWHPRKRLSVRKIKRANNRSNL
jgi:hypothetical protein